MKVYWDLGAFSTLVLFPVEMLKNSSVDLLVVFLLTDVRLIFKVLA